MLRAVAITVGTTVFAAGAAVAVAVGHQTRTALPADHGIAPLQADPARVVAVHAPAPARAEAVVRHRVVPAPQAFVAPAEAVTPSGAVRAFASPEVSARPVPRRGAPTPAARIADIFDSPLDAGRTLPAAEARSIDLGRAEPGFGARGTTDAPVWSTGVYR